MRSPSRRPIGSKSLLLALPLLAGCAAEAVSPRADPAPHPPAGTAAVPGALVPTGARIGPAGFATVERAPPVPYPDAPPPAEDRPESEAAWYASWLGISEAEAARRQREQQAIRPELERLMESLRAREAGNFTASRMVHQPDWAYVFYFRRDPAGTLARYTANPRFQAAQARYTRAELEALLQPWIDRFTRHRLTSGWGIDETYGRAEIMIDTTEAEFRAVAAREGWGALPDAIALTFAPPLLHPAVEEAARPFVRLFARNDRSGGIQLLAGGSGRIVLRDGCLFVEGGGGGAARLAYFHRETGLGLDAEGYLALKDRLTGETRGRIGEWFSYAGPNASGEDMPMVAELRARCGTAPLLNVGNPESAHRFRARAVVVDELARARGIGRRQAWDMLKRCWARNDAARPDAPPSGDCRF
ncbi:MAG: hypothetical protein ACK40O_02845 [Allosphingosinicella sp.]